MPTITASNPTKIFDEIINPIPEIPIFKINNKYYHIRFLTERECWRLMGFTDDDFNKVSEKVKSKSKLYMLAGNSIVVQVLEAIFKELIDNSLIYLTKEGIDDDNKTNAKTY